MQELKLVNKYAEKFLSENAIREAAPKGVEALKTLHSKSGAGNDFLGWLPQIMIKKNSQESKRLPNISKRIRIFLLLSVSAVLISAQER
jgi:hypothetical protein